MTRRYTVGATVILVESESISIIRLEPKLLKEYQEDEIQKKTNEQYELKMTMNEEEYNSFLGQIIHNQQKCDDIAKCIKTYL